MHLKILLPAALAALTVMFAAQSCNHFHAPKSASTGNNNEGNGGDSSNDGSSGGEDSAQNVVLPTVVNGNIIVNIKWGSQARNRAITGAAPDVIENGKIINYYQLITMRTDEDGIISGFAEASVVENKNILTIAVEPGKTYHVLMLAGHLPSHNQNGSGLEPTLLSSAYAQVKVPDEMKNNRSNIKNEIPVDFYMTPAVIDTSVYHVDGAGCKTPVPVIPGEPVSLKPASDYYIIYHVGEKMIDDNGVEAAAGDGLWPLKLADPSVREKNIWRFYQHGEPVSGRKLDDISLTLQNTRDSSYAYLYFEGSHPRYLEDANGSSATHSTTGTAKFGLTTPQEKTKGRVYFNMKYVPFAAFNAADWSGVNITTPPVWKIRNGLNDLPPLSGEAGFDNTFDAGAGAIPLVVSE